MQVTIVNQNGQTINIKNVKGYNHVIENEQAAHHFFISMEDIDANEMYDIATFRALRTKRDSRDNQLQMRINVIHCTVFAIN